MIIFSFFIVISSTIFYRLYIYCGIASNITESQKYHENKDIFHRRYNNEYILTVAILYVFFKEKRKNNSKTINLNPNKMKINTMSSF